ncbi:MAG: TfpX/TfpZ family type IV pilin accessory protein [Methylotenera sp.]|uniref:TfpX/TfpZ family type IV pilin accessory protein n=1 Tax=Methylotenera sp. TaxID=2051956 RepID=UPI00271F85EE|nr:TfpX/TfpZ family type IV pilin accessory protein [Methylotenera sp.]MDO9394687.1 TfpX/TfpZ family type IV pilin accessory protein [Methylotenera sp.]
MSRLKAASLHLLLSFFIVTLVLTGMYLVWYPNSYMTLMGGKKLVAILATVDIFLGPLLTFSIFKAGKKGLRFDLFCIAILQIAALFYGAYVMSQSRPVFTVFNKDEFQVAAIVDIAPEELAKAKKPQWRQPPLKGPELVAIGIPDRKNRQESMFAMVESQIAFRYPRLYDDYNKHLGEVIKAGRPLASISAISAENKSAITQFINKHQRPESDFLAIPIKSELAEMSAIVDAKTGGFIEIIDARLKGKIGSDSN